MRSIVVKMRGGGAALVNVDDIVSARSLLEWPGFNRSTEITLRHGEPVTYVEDTPAEIQAMIDRAVPR